MKISQAEVGKRVVYIPTHAENDPMHKDAEFGEITSIKAGYVFVRFDKQVHKHGWQDATSLSCYPDDVHYYKVEIVQ